MERPDERITCQILDAHGAIKRWDRYEKVEATIVSGGGLFQLKGVPQDSNPRRMTVWLHEERSSVSPYGAPDQRRAWRRRKHRQNSGPSTQAQTFRHAAPR
jgi:hypothetical protein